MKGITLPDREEDFTADPVELFFDLAYVFAFAQLVSWLVHHPTWTGAAEAALLFVLIWFMWSWFTWSANAVSGNSRPVRLVFLVGTALTVPLAASIEGAFENTGLVFGGSAAILMVLVVVLSLLSHDRDSEVFRSIMQFAAPNFAVMGLLVAGGILEDIARVVCWSLALVIIVGSTIAAGSNEWIVRIGHFAERHGLIFIIALGEVIVALGLSFVEASEGDEITTSTVAGLVAAGIFAGLLWWSYFDRFSPALEHKGSELQGNDLSRFVRNVFTYWHTFIIAGIIASAAALEEALLHPDDPLYIEFRVMLAAGLALFWIGVIGSVYQYYKVVATERILAVAALIVLVLAGSELKGVWLVALVDLVLFVALVFEHRRIETGAAATVGA